MQRRCTIGITLLSIGLLFFLAGAGWQGFQRIGLISPQGYEAKLTAGGAIKMTVNDPGAQPEVNPPSAAYQRHAFIYSQDPNNGAKITSDGRIYVDIEGVVGGGGADWGDIGGTLADQTDLQAALDAKVPTSRTVCGDPLSSNVTCTASDVGLGSVDNTSDATKNSATAILTNKQYVARSVQLSAASGTVTAPDADAADILYRYDISGGITIPAPTATGSNPRHGQILAFRFKSAAPQTITWNAIYAAENGVALTTSTTGNGTTYDEVVFRYNTTSSKWGVWYTTITPAAVPSARVITVQGTSNEISCVGGGQDLSADRTWTCALASTTSLANKKFLPPQGTTLPGTCGVGEVFFKTNATAGQNWYGCTAANTWTLMSGSTPTGFVPDVRTVCGDPLTADVTCTASDVGLGNVDNTSDATKNAATAILTNKQIVDRSTQLSAASGTVTAPNADSADILYRYDISGTLTIPNPTASGSNPRHGQTLTFSFKSATPQSISWGANYTAENGIPLLILTTGDGNTYDQVVFRYNTTSTKWGMLASTRNPRGVTALSSATTFTCPADSSSMCEMQMTAGAGTLTVAAPTGTPFNGQSLRMRFLCTNAQTFSWNAIFLSSLGVTLPSTCPADTTKWLEVEHEYSSVLTKWQIMRTSNSSAVTDGDDDGATKGIVAFANADMDCTAGVCAIAYSTGQAASASVPGFLAAAAYTAFNKGYIHLPVVGAHQPSSNPAIIDRSENHEKLLFDDTTAECAWWNFRMNPDYTSGLTAKIPFSMASATSGTVVFGVYVMAVTPGDSADNNTDSYASVNTSAATTVPGTAGHLGEISVTLTNADSAAAGDEMRVKVCLDTSGTATGDAEILNEIMLEYAKQ